MLCHGLIAAAGKDGAKINWEKHIGFRIDREFKGKRPILPSARAGL